MHLSRMVDILVWSRAECGYKNVSYVKGNKKRVTDLRKNCIYFIIFHFTNEV